MNAADTLDNFNQNLIRFLDDSPTPFHAVASLSALLCDAGFSELKEGDSWSLESGHGYYVTRNDSSIIAFRYLPEAMLERGLPMVGAHTDSPCLKIKPKPELLRNSYQQLGVETYGGVLLAPWFDRDLSIAGRVNYRDHQGELKSALIDYRRAVALVPNLAIHLNREANSGNKINAQKHLPPILFQGERFQGKKVDNFDWREELAAQLKREGIEDCDKVFDFELSFYDTQGAAIVGMREEFLCSARLDNLLSCFIGVQALINADAGQPALLVCNDHEEVGSASACGAQGPMLEQCLQRMIPDTETRLRVVDKSMMISADNAHGIHPNYSDVHDQNHGPLLNHGPVIKVNANQRYASNSETSTLFKHLCEQAEVPVQEFVTRTDLGCGSTIGPITASETGIKTLDVGVPTFAMHSIRETAGVKDSFDLSKVLQRFFNQF